LDKQFKFIMISFHIFVMVVINYQKGGD